MIFDEDNIEKLAQTIVDNRERFIVVPYEDASGNFVHVAFTLFELRGVGSAMFLLAKYYGGPESDKPTDDDYIYICMPIKKSKAYVGIRPDALTLGAFERIQDAIEHILDAVKDY